MAISDSAENIIIIEKETDDFFLDLIKERPCLYDKRLPEHHDKIVLENAMEEVAFNMQDTVENCQKKWKQFQAAYHREKMLQEQETRSGAGASQRKKWPFFERMKSFYCFNTYRHSYTNVNKKLSNGKESKLQLDYVNPKKRKVENLVISAFNNVQSTLTSMINAKQNENLTSTLKKQEGTDTEKEDCSTLIGKLIASRLHELQPNIAKKKENLF